MLYSISYEELTETYESLTDEQKNALSKNIKQGQKTKWLNQWAKKKGVVLTEEELLDPDDAMNKLLEWMLVDYEDALVRSSDLRCECGRKLRYRYTVRHKSTGIEYKLGIDHLTQHTGLDAETVRLIRKGLVEINYERDEILSKVLAGWKLPIEIPPDIEIPLDIQELLRVHLPLLDKHVVKLKKLIQTKENAQRPFDIEQIKKQIAAHKPKESASRQTYGFEKTKLNIEINEDVPVTNSIDSRDALILINNLKMHRISSAEARDLYYYLKHNKRVLSDNGIHLYLIKAEANKALGRIGNVEVRKWLVEIDEL